MAVERETEREKYRPPRSVLMNVFESDALRGLIMMETYDNLLTQSPTINSSSSEHRSNTSLSGSVFHTTTNSIDGRTGGSVSVVNSTLLPWDVIADNFLRQLNGQEKARENETELPAGGLAGEIYRNIGIGGSTEAAIRQLPFAAYQSLAAISTQATGTLEIADSIQGHGDVSGGGLVGGQSHPFVSWASMVTTSSQVFFVIKVVIMCFIIVSAVFGNLLVIVSVMRHRKLR